MNSKAAIALLVVAGIVLGTIAVNSNSGTVDPVPVLSAPEVAPHALSGEVPAGFVVQTLEIEGMCCEGCTRKLHTALMEVPGVREAAVDLLRNRAMAVLPADAPTAPLTAACSFDDYVATLRGSEPISK